MSSLEVVTKMSLLTLWCKLVWGSRKIKSRMTFKFCPNTFLVLKKQTCPGNRRYLVNPHKRKCCHYCYIPCARSIFWHFKNSPCDIMCWTLHLNKLVLETEKISLLFLCNWGTQIIIIISPLHESKMKKIQFCLWVRVKMTSFCCRLLLLPTDKWPSASHFLSYLVPPTEFTSSSARVQSVRKHSVRGNNVRDKNI